MRTRYIRPGDAAEWARLRQLLWPARPGEHEREIAAFFGGDRRDPAQVILAIGEAGRALGFAEVSVRSYAEGCVTDRVAYLEGWFVEEPHRRCGIGAALVAAVEDWARAQGCTELASDTELENGISATAHQALGFGEVERIICFKKELSPAPGTATLRKQLDPGASFEGRVS
jgi:aminoglycoside 6'-N-acetyltransferase I